MRYRDIDHAVAARGFQRVDVYERVVMNLGVVRRYDPSPYRPSRVYFLNAECSPNNSQRRNLTIQTHPHSCHRTQSASGPPRTIAFALELSQMVTDESARPVTELSFDSTSFNP
jgi:hypothetical protein